MTHGVSTQTVSKTQFDVDLTRKMSTNKQLTKPHVQSSPQHRIMGDLLSDDLMILIFNQIVMIDLTTAVHVLPLVCRRWHQLLRTAITFRTQPFKAKKYPILTCSVATVASRFNAVQSLRLNEFARVTQHCYTTIAERCPNVTNVDFQRSFKRDMQITNEQLKVVSLGCQRITHINLRCCHHITDEGFSFVERLVYLTHLDLSSTSITDGGLKRIVFGCYQITHVCLSGCLYITDVGFAAVGRLRYLTHLQIDSTRVSDAGLTAVAAGCHDLIRLDLGRCGSITDMGCATVGRLQSLTRLDLSNTRITDAGLEAIASKCHYLTRLNLHKCKSITNVGFIVVGLIGSLTHLNISNTQITNAGLISISSGCGHLVYLDITDCRRITKEGYTVYNINRQR